MGGKTKHGEGNLLYFPSEGRRISDKHVKMYNAVLPLLEQIERAAKAHDEYVRDRFRGSSNVRSAEFFRSKSVLHLSGVTRRVIKEALDDDRPDGIETAIETANALKEKVLDSDFLKTHDDQENRETPSVQLTRIKFAEWEKETHATWTETPISRMHSEISKILKGAADAFGVPLLTFENLKKQPPPLVSDQCG